MQVRIFLASFLLAASHYASAAEFPHTVSSNEARAGDHIEVSMWLGLNSFPLAGLNPDDDIGDGDELKPYFEFGIEGRLQYDRVFLELTRESLDTYALGYSVYENEHSSFELLAAKLFDSVRRGNFEQFWNIKDRKGDFNAGFRYSRYFENTVLQSELVRDISRAHSGYIGTVQLGQQRQFGNWGMHGLVGVRYFSADVLDHYFGLPQEQAGAIGSGDPYSAGSGFIRTVQIGASYPLSEKFVFNLGVEYDQFPDAIKKSPLAQGGSRSDVRIGISYIVGGG